MLSCLILALSSVNWVQLYEEIQYLKLKMRFWKRGK
jgi:hypothetical protein